MFHDYTKAVLGAYHEKLKAHQLSLRLIKPSPALVRNECLAVFTKRYNKRDERVLSLFFEPGEKGYAMAIKKCEIDKFKPVINFIKGKVETAQPQTVELLAWLIDFKDRPFDPDKSYDKLGATSTPVPKIIDENAVDNTTSKKIEPSSLEGNHEPVIHPIGSNLMATNEGGRSVKSQKWRWGAFVVVGVVLAGFLWLYNKRIVYRSTGPQNCMYWDGNSFIKASCNESRVTSQLIAYDSVRQQSFHRINKPDTITLSSVGKLWYSKYKNQFEYFTDSGPHPIDPTRSLHPLTRYIVLNHLAEKLVAE